MYKRLKYLDIRKIYFIDNNNFYSQNNLKFLIGFFVTLLSNNFLGSTLIFKYKLI